MKFTKMHGAGNDYIYIDGTKEHMTDAGKWAKRLSDRHFGIGSDGVVLILPSDTCDFRMKMYNSDGSEAEMCGNASRCIGKYVYDKKLTNKKTITLETKAGVKTLELIVKNDEVSAVKVDMGEPCFESHRIPVTIEKNIVKDYPIEIEGNTYSVTALSMGNPHAVIFIDEDLANYPVHKIGPLLEKHPIFPQKANIEFARVITPDQIQMRVWERGAGETLACGTGACATLVAAALAGRSNNIATLQLLGGTLQIQWNKENNHVYMTGPAVTVYEGEIEL